MPNWTWQKIQAIGRYCEASFRVCPICAGRVRYARRSDITRLRLGRYFKGLDIPAIDKCCDTCGVDFNVKSYNPRNQGRFVAKAMSARPWKVLSHKRTAFVWIHPKTGAMVHWDFACNATHKHIYNIQDRITDQIFFRFAVA